MNTGILNLHLDILNKIPANAKRFDGRSDELALSDKGGMINANDGGN